MPELEIDHGVGGGQRVRQQPLEALELLLSANDRAFLLLQLVDQLEALAPQCIFERVGPSAMRGRDARVAESTFRLPLAQPPRRRLLK